MQVLFILSHVRTFWALAKLYREAEWSVRYMRMTRRYKADINTRFWALTQK